jgi:hypothetical protein
VKAVEIAKNTVPDLAAMAADEKKQGVLFLTFVETASFEGPDPVPTAVLSSWGGRSWQNPATGALTNIIQYKSWGGSNWQVAFNGSLFAHAQGTSDTGHADFLIRFLDHNRIQWMAVFGNGAFLVYEDLGLLKFRTDTLEMLNHAGQPVRFRLSGASPQSNPLRPLFVHQWQHSAQEHVDSRLDYKTWDGTNWRAFLGTGTALLASFPLWWFLHVPAEGGWFHADFLINYKGWDGLDYTTYADTANKRFHVARKGGGTGNVSAVSVLQDSRRN